MPRTGLGAYSLGVYSLGACSSSRKRQRCVEVDALATSDDELKTPKARQEHIASGWALQFQLPSGPQTDYELQQAAQKDLQDLQEDGLPVVWPHNHVRKTTAKPSPCTEGAVRLPEPQRVRAMASQAAEENVMHDLQELYDNGFPVIWPRGHGPLASRQSRQSLG